MADTDLETLTATEAGIAALKDPGALLSTLDTIAHLEAGEDDRSVRYGLARGVVLNRLGLPGAALAALQAARRLADRIGSAERLAAVSREIARVHAWRGETAPAALELFRSVIAADGDATETAAAVADFGRLNLETGRYESALAACEVALARADVLSDRDRARLPVNRCEALAALGRHDTCLAAVEAAIADVPARFRRDHFVLRLVQSRCLAALGRPEEAAIAVTAADAFLTDDPQSYERAERDLAVGFLLRDSDPEQAAILVDGALDRFVDDDLPRHEFDARILLAELLVRLDRRPEAEACIVEALRRAEGRQLPAMADRVRAAAVGLWRPDRIAELSPEDQVGATGGSGRFLVLESLGSGGFGAVQRAIDLDTGEEVAIKRLRASLEDDPEAAGVAMATVRNEAASAARLPNRFVARTRYVHMGADGTVTLVQDYIAGPTLRESLRDGTLDRARRFRIAAGLTRTVAALHKHGLAHRDLKPGNVILRGGAQPVLIDLGLARLKGQADAVAGLGTESYAPPEQLRGDATDPRWFGREDVFALGRIIAELTADDDSDSGGGWLGRLGRRRSGGSDDTLAGMIAVMTDPDVTRRAVDLDAVADALDAAARA
ncbi:protein kinase domain-containing protein [Bauldia sp.]|uniref:protein kinase domain-containing protein n=1 Tax=Bauldia sp. TaxID=2575872 RepID=UPI003BA8DBF4